MMAQGQDFDDMLRNEGPQAVAAILVGDKAEQCSPASISKLRQTSLDFDIAMMNQQYALVTWGARAVVVRESRHAATPVEDRLRFLTLEAFKAFYANRTTEVAAADGRRKSVTWAQAWLTHARRRTYEGIDFFPNPDGAEAPPNYLNLWNGFGFEPSETGTCEIFKDHLRTNVCNGDDALYKYVFGWFAHMMQKPRERLGTSLVLRGGMGTGKTVVGNVIGSLIPNHYYAVDDARHVVGNFNAHMASCLLLQAEEAVWAGDKQAEGRLKGLVTSDIQMIEAKGADVVRLKNYVRVFMTSNEQWVVPAGKDERRFFVLDVAPYVAQNHDYFSEMYEELDNGGRARLLYELLNFDLAAVNLRKIPHTAGLYEQKLRSLDPLDSWWYDRLTAGSPTRELDIWPVAVNREALFKDYINAANETGARRKLNPSQFGQRIGQFGIRDSRRPTVETSPGVSERVWQYVLPTLDQCREIFAEIMGGSAPDWSEAS